jgi:mannose-6-phosphate isomerase
MPKLDVPLRLSPVFKPRIWGRENLAPLFERDWSVPGSRLRGQGQAKPEGRGERIGEVWLTGDEARFLNGPVAGLTLGEVSREFGRALHGQAWNGQRFPLLAKYLFTSDWLSIQVHPDDEYAGRHEAGSFGKCEMWYFLAVERKAACLLGLKPGTSREDWRQAVAQGRAAGSLQLFHPRVGESVYVPPGTVHALGPGLVLFEVEQNSDITYRLHDFGRLGADGKPRPLHVDRGLAVTRPELKAERNLPRIKVEEPFGWRRYVLACPHFALEEWHVKRQAALEGHAERVECLAIVSGQGRMETAAGWLAYDPADTWLIPPATPPFRLVPERTTRLFRFYVPDVDRDFRQRLVERGVKPALICAVCRD